MATIRTFAIGSPAQMPGDPATLRNRGRCTVEEVTISLISETGARLEVPRTEYVVAVPGDTAFALYGDELLACPGSVLSEHRYRP
jgi:hypothetical protein